MPKFIIFVFAVICFANANPIMGDWGSTAAGQSSYNNNGNWPNRQFGQFPQPQLPRFQWPQISVPRPLTPQEIANIKPGPGSVVNGVAQEMSSHTEYINGKPVTKVEGQTTWNRNGDVQKESFGNKER